jgi:hypothetical protein
MTFALSNPKTFSGELAEQRWDDHRYYHQSRMNQTLHLISACCFLGVYALVPFYPAYAAIIGWIVPMWVRQIGHFFFEPRGFDEVNDATFEHKEAIKVGFNLQRKVILLALWISVPGVLWLSPTAFGLMPAFGSTGEWINRVGLAWLWLAGLGLMARVLWLAATRSVQTGAVWLTKILTDPINDIRTYYRAPLFLMKGEWIDPMDHVQSHRWRRPFRASSIFGSSGVSSDIREPSAPSRRVHDGWRQPWWRRWLGRPRRHVR